MPYIEPEQRKRFDRWVDALACLQLSLGELNYVITKLLLATKPRCYTDFNSLIGVLECVKLEFYARKVRPYEDMKKDEHGEVYL